MENIFELIIPIIIFVIVGIGKLIEMSQSSGKNPQQQPRRVDPEEAERRRRVQEEIQRRIRERQEAAGAAPTARVEPREYDPHVPDGQQRRTAPPPIPGRSGPPPIPGQPQPVYPTPTRAYAPEPVAPSRDYEGELRKQREAAARARREADEARQKAEERIRKAMGSGESRANAYAISNDAYAIKVVSAYGLSADVREMLSSPAAARRAFVITEILGKPVGQRAPDGSSKPHWA